MVTAEPAELYGIAAGSAKPVVVIDVEQSNGSPMTVITWSKNNDGWPVGMISQR